MPTTRTVVVVSERDEEIARAQLGLYPGVEVVRQPADRGTAAGLMLGLAHVRARDPHAEVAVFPSDHHVKDATAWCTAVRRARAAARIAPSGVALLGAPADRPATDLGWIVPGGLELGGGDLPRGPGPASSWKSRPGRAGAVASGRGRAVEHDGGGGPGGARSGGWARCTCRRRCSSSSGTCGPSATARAYDLLSRQLRPADPRPTSAATSCRWRPGWRWCRWSVRAGSIAARPSVWSTGWSRPTTRPACWRGSRAGRARRRRRSGLLSRLPERARVSGAPRLDRPGARG